MAKVQMWIQWSMQLVCVVSMILMLFVAIPPRPRSRSESITKEKCREVVEITEGHREKREVKEIHGTDSKSKLALNNVDKVANPNPPKVPKENTKPKQTTPKNLLKGSGNVSREFKEFIKLRPDETFNSKFDFIVSGDNICADKNRAFLLILCVSNYLHMERRKVIRKTWAGVAKDGTWPFQRGKLPVKIVFVLGNPGTSAVKNAIVKEENEKFGDIVVVDVDESSYSNAKRVLAGLKWVTKHCSIMKYILKINEKTMVHLPNLIAYLKPFKIPERGLLIGNMYPNAKVLRGGEWALNQTVYPFEIYPPYLDGDSYVISGNVVSRLYNAAIHLPYIYIENVFITGLAREAVGAEIKNKAGFASNKERAPGLCSLHQKGRMSVTPEKASFQTQIWEALHNESCTED